jgi:hypothetical protein
MVYGSTMVALVGSVMVHGGGSDRRNHLWREAVEEHHHHHLCGAIFVAGHAVGDDGIIDESITVPELCVSQCKGCVHDHGEEHRDVDLWRRCCWRRVMKLS